MGDVLVWLEDRPDEIENMVKRAMMSGFVVEIFRKPVQVADFLVESGKGVAGLVVDVMLFGVNDLSDLGIPASDTEAGYDAGWLFVDRFLRAPGSPYADIPVLILSVRRMERTHQEMCDDIRSRGGASLDVIPKWQEDTSWKFRGWLHNLGSSAASDSAADLSERK